MNNLYDKKLTGRFKDALENYEAVYDPADWNDMQKRLGHKNNYRRWIIGGIALLAASIFMGALFLPVMEEQLPQQSTALQQSASPGAPTANGINADKHTLADNTTNNSATAVASGADHDPHKANTSGSKHLYKRKKHNAALPPYSGKKAQADVAGPPDKKWMPLADVAAVKTKDTGMEASAEQATDKQDLALLDQLDVQLLKIKKALPDIKSQNNNRADLKPVKEPWRFGLALMPGINRFTFDTKDAKNAANFAPIKNSEVMEINIKKQGVSAGFAVEKTMGKKWILGSGAQLTYVHLQLSDRRAFLESSPIKVDADLGLPSRERYLKEEQWIRLNVPIQVRYNLISDAKRELFVSTGLSNFFYLHETYTYQEQVPLKSNAFLPDFAMTTKKVSKQPLTRSSVNMAASIYLSAGIERKMGRYTSLQFEPFLMLPLKNSRHDALQMSTTGISMRVNYQRAL